jgi:integrase
MRLSEALGLVWDDIKLDQQFPHIDLVPHSWRQLKTAGSKRVIALIGCAYEAIKIIHK